MVLTEWCAPIVVALKKNSDQICMCVDLSKLNRFVCWERSPSITPAEVVADMTIEQVITPHAQRERGKVIGRGVHIYIYIYVTGYAKTAHFAHTTNFCFSSPC